MTPFTFTNHYSDLPPICFSHANPTPVEKPEFVIFNHALGAELGVSESDFFGESSLEILSGNSVFPNATPLSLAYAGHQFGNFVPQLGDGRAHVLGQLPDLKETLWDIQLKGSGRTCFSRGGDGRSALGPAIREYIVSEAMAALGVPTTRTLAVISTGESVFRGSELPGGLSVRVARSHIRVGSFEYLAARGLNQEFKALLDHVITHHYPECRHSESPYLDFFKALINRSALLVAHWIRVGFIHGVMNTDNTSIIGDTIDYGPCAFMDQYSASKVFSSIDRSGRYAFNQQSRIMKWNLSSLAQCMMNAIGDTEIKLEEIQHALDSFDETYDAHWLQMRCEKMSLSPEAPDAEKEIKSFLSEMESESRDYTNTFHTQFPHGKGNPLYIPRNHKVAEAIEAAETHADYGPLHALCSVLEKPYEENSAGTPYQTPPQPEEEVTETFCGT